MNVKQTQQGSPMIINNRARIKAFKQLRFNELFAALIVGTGLLITHSTLAQSPSSTAFKEADNIQQYKVADFSDRYDAEILVNKELDEQQVSIVVKDADTQEVIINQPSDIDIEYELSDSIDDSSKDNVISANIVEAPYGSHSVLIYDDFNFDNKKDLALEDGRYGCYGGPSYKIYLQQDNGFAYSDTFTDLTYGNCGFFYIDKETQTLHTMTKSGAAWHKYSVYNVVDNKPVIEQDIVEEGEVRGLFKITVTTYEDDDKHIESFLILPSSDEQIPNSFYSVTLINDKKLLLGSYDRKRLYYAFADQNDRIELFYEGEFVYDHRANTLSFYNKPVTYVINDKGIRVQMPNKTQFLESKPNSVQGKLINLLKYENVKLISKPSVD